MLSNQKNGKASDDRIKIGDAELDTGSNSIIHVSKPNTELASSYPKVIEALSEMYVKNESRLYAVSLSFCPKDCATGYDARMITLRNRDGGLDVALRHINVTDPELISRGDDSGIEKNMKEKAAFITSKLDEKGGDKTVVLKPHTESYNDGFNDGVIEMYKKNAVISPSMVTDIVGMNLDVHKLYEVTLFFLADDQKKSANGAFWVSQGKFFFGSTLIPRREAVLSETAKEGLKIDLKCYTNSFLSFEGYGKLMKRTSSEACMVAALLDEKFKRTGLMDAMRTAIREIDESNIPKTKSVRR